MNEAIRRQALQTTAKIALSLTVLACGGTVEIANQTATATDDPPDPELPIHEEDEEEPPVQLFRPEAETLACEAAPVGEEVALLDAEQLDCCTELLESVWPVEGPNAWEQWQRSMQDPDVGACCNVVVAHANQQVELLDTLGWQNVQMCCDAAGAPFGAACTPWGPPVPPAMRPFADLDALEIA